MPVSDPFGVSGNVDPWKSPIQLIKKSNAKPGEQAELVRVVLMIDANVKVQGIVSGKAYAFSGAGSIADVDKLDVDYLLLKRQGGRQCCGGTEFGNQVFGLVGE